MQFRTQIPISKSNFPIDYNSKIISLGSCFAENMADKFDYYKFQNTRNPFGILFHPLAIKKFIDFAVTQKTFTQSDIFFHNERWHCFDAHSDLSNANANELLANLNGIVKLMHEKINEATHFIITYGTAWVYQDIESNSVVANCHKVPQKHFKKELLTVQKIEVSIANTIHLIKSVNPKINIIFTVSPVRHIKDGFVENQWSKSNLFSAIHSVLNSEQNKSHSEYFPSYEIMMDELRDYRFYNEDMLHPNQVAIDYIWERFMGNTISDKAYQIIEEVDSIQRGLSHRPFNPNSESHQKFEFKLRSKISDLVSQFPFMKF